MKSCSDKRFENMRGPWEMGMLEESERLEFELHIYECESCRQSLLESQDAAWALRHADEVRTRAADSAANESSLTARKAHVKQRQKRRWNRWSMAMPVSLVAAVVFLILVFRPWQIDIRPTDDAMAAEDRLIILYFTNVPEPSDSVHLGDIATNLLITDIGESQYLRVTSCERLLSIAMNLGYDKAQFRQPDISLDVARQAKARWMLTGEILRVEPELALASRLIDVTTGDVIATQQVFAEVGEDIFAVIDKLSAEVKRDLPLPPGAVHEQSRAIADITTHSPEAYSHYLKGVEYRTRLYIKEAIDQFELALKYDSTLAMAYYHLASLKDRELIHKALAFAHNAGRRDKYHINTSHALISGDTAEAMVILQELIKDYPDETYALWRYGQICVALGRSEIAIPYFEEAIRVDPSYRNAYNSLAYAYDAVGNWEQSIRTINTYIDIAPEEANPHDTRGDLYAGRGQVDSAIESYKRALSIRPDFLASLQKLSQQYILKGDFEHADSCYRVLSQAADSPSRSVARRTLASLLLMQGQYARATRLLDTLISADSSDAEYGGALGMILIKSQVLVRMDQYDKARETLERCQGIIEVAPHLKTAGFHSHYINGLAEAGMIEEARRELELLESQPKYGEGMRGHCWFARGHVEFFDNNFQLSLRAFEQARQLITGSVFKYMMARAYLETQQLSNAIELFESIIDDSSSRNISWEIWHVEVDYFLGRSYEESGEFKRAIEQYNTFLSHWRDVDTNLPMMVDAQERLDRLKQNP